MPQTSTAAFDEAQAALRAYNDVVDSDGATATVWTSLAERLTAAARGLEGQRKIFVADRATDCTARAQTATRMVAHARSLRTIDMSTLIEVA